MYIIELYFKIKEKFQNRISFKNKKPVKIIQEQVEKCNHLFVPIDSTKKILACSKCGEIYKLKKGEINPFLDN